MKTKLTLIKRIAVLVLFSALNPQLSTWAQGTAFTYQGRLNDGASPGTGSYDLTFSVFAAGTGGSPLAGPLTNSATAVSNGLFTVTLDFGAGMFTGPDRFLEISVRTNGGGAFTTLSPRQKLTPAPYAIYSTGAANAGIASGVAPGSVTGAGIAPATITAGNIAGGQVVKSFNGFSDAVTLAPGPNVTLSSSGNGLLISSFGTWNQTGNSGTSPTNGNFLGTTDFQPLELRVNGLRGLRLEPTANDASHSNIVNVVNGSPVNFVAPGTYAATISGGGAQNNSGFYAYSNSVASDYGTVAGGAGNAIQANSFGAAISGGVGNQIQTNAYESVIAGGLGNTIQASAKESAIGGGNGNLIQSNSVAANIGGGWFNTIQSGAFSSTIGGGNGNTIQTNTQYSAIGGGGANMIQTNSTSSTIGGGGVNTIQNNVNSATISGGCFNTIQSNASYSTIGGGYSNIILGSYAVVPGGLFNSNSGFCATVGGGQENIAGGTEAAVGGGFANTSSADWGTVAGGDLNTIFATAIHSTIGGGFNNNIRTNSPYSTIGGGYGNTIALNAFSATIPGGTLNAAAGNYSFAAGFKAQALHDGAFVWADSQSAVFASTGVNQFLIRAAGGVGIGSASPQAQLHVTGADANQLILQNSTDARFWELYDENFGGSGALIFQPNTGVGAYIRRSDGNYVVNSDLRLKQDITPLGGVLDRVLQLRPVSYHFRTAPEGTLLSLGLIAQEVEPLFPEVVNEHDGFKGLVYSELVPVTIRAIQELNQKLELDLAAQQKASEAKIQGLEQENENLRLRLEKIERWMARTDVAAK